MEATITLLCFLARLQRVSISNKAELLSSPEVGSSNSNIEGLVNSSQPMLALFFSPPDKPRTSTLPMTVQHHLLLQHFIIIIRHLLVSAQSCSRSVVMVSSTFANFSCKLNSLGSLKSAEYCFSNQGDSLR